MPVRISYKKAVVICKDDKCIELSREELKELKKLLRGLEVAEEEVEEYEVGEEEEKEEKEEKGLLEVLFGK
jgi:hypothetical protein